MAIIATGSSGALYTPAPAGTYPAVCVDVVDEGMKPTPNGEKHKVSLHFQIDEPFPGKPGEFFTVRKWYTLSLNEKATLYADLVAWRGKPFTDEELAGFDLEKLIGVPCIVNIVHKPSADGSRTYANITSIMRPMKGTAPFTGGPYTRLKDRAVQDAAPVSDAAEPEMTGDELDAALAEIGDF